MLQRCSKIVRYFHRTCPQMIKKKPTPGAGRQLKALDRPDEFVEDPEGFGDFESDFMRLDKTHRQHEAEQQLQRDRVRHMMVKRKYFKEPRQPALLLYAEINEIRTLHARDPEEWTVEKLAESFPATADTISKIVNSTWRPYSMKRIQKHDEAVIRNWENLKNGNEENDFHISSELREHFLKFAKRTLNKTAANDVNEALLVPKLPTPAHNEFTSIITSCKKYAEKHKEALKLPHAEVEAPLKRESKAKIDPADETYLIDKVTDKRKMRFEEFQKLKLSEASFEKFEKETEGNGSSLIEQQQPENPAGTGFIQKFASTEIVVSAADSKKYEMTPYKDKIYIPRKLWRKGGTYRVEDCYYDDDGEFLYRVPGMSGTK